MYFNCYDQMFVPISLQLEISRAYHPMYPYSITESRDNSVKQAGDCRLWLCIVTTFLFVEKLLTKTQAYSRHISSRIFCSFVNLSPIIVTVLIHRQEQNTVNCGLADTPIIWTAAKSPAKTNYRRLTETLAITDSH